MTKEELYDELFSCETEYGINSTDVGNVLYKFFELNVCITKGKNRHPYADVLHEWIEGGITLEELSDPMNRWDETDTIAFGYKYRIKPPEPVYECMYYDRSGKIYWLTDDEFKSMLKSEPKEYFKAGETKRIRK
jgi:hypothetical protein